MSEKSLKKSNISDLVRPSVIIRELLHLAKQNTFEVRASDVSLIFPNYNEEKADILVYPLPNSDLYNLIIWNKGHGFEQQELRSANDKDKSFGQIGRALAHEVKNPLAGIRGAAQLLMLDAAEDQKPLAKLIIDETDRIHRLIDRVESLGLDAPVPKTPINIHSVLERVVKLAENGFASNLNISRQFDVSLPKVLGDSDRLTQILLNLAKNAAEAANEKGEAGQIIFSTAYKHGYKIRNSNGERSHLPIEISIADNGYGIPDELRNFLFDPFVTTKSEGSGLGLALVRKMVAAHSGVVEFETQPGKTIFKVRLPAANTDTGEGNYE